METPYESENPTQEAEPQQETQQQETLAVPQQPVVSPTQFNWQELYQQSVRERGVLEAQLEARREAPQQQQRAVVTDDQVREQPVEALRTLMRDEMRSELAEVRQFGAQFRAQQEIAAAEQTVFSRNPHLVQFHQELAPQVRQRIAQSGLPVNPATYDMALKAVIGDYTLAQAGRPVQPQAATQQTQQLDNTMPTKPPAGRAPVGGSNAPRLTEAEKTAMKRVRLDPMKPDDVKEFQRLISDDPYVV